MNLTQVQIQYVVDNILWLLPGALFIFTSTCIGFWKLVGKLFKKKPIKVQVPLKEEVLLPSKEELGSSAESIKTQESEVSDKPSFLQTPVEPNKEDYLDLTKERDGT